MKLVKFRTLALIGYRLMLMSFVFGMAEAFFFGFNTNNKMKLLCDHISVCICITGSSLFIFCIMINFLKLNNKSNDTTKKC